MSKKYLSPKEYLDAAKSELTPVSELAYLANSEYNFVKLAVAENPNTTEEILSSLVPGTLESWNEQEIAASLTQNSKTGSETLRILAEKLTPVLNGGRNNDMAFKAGVSLCCNPKTPIDAIQSVLVCDKVSTLFRRKAARETSREDVLKLLLNDKSEAVRKRVSKNIEPESTVLS
jgi:hypothetical protein